METALSSPFVLLKKAWSLGLAKPNITSYLVLGFIPQLLSLIFSAVVTYFTGQDLFSNSNGWMVAGFIILGIIAIVLIAFISTWYTALLYKVYQATAEGNLSPISSYIRPAKDVTLILLATYMTVGLFTSLGFLLLIVPGIIIAVRYMFAPMIAAVEDRSIKPIDESKRLVKGRFWKLVGRSIVMIVAYNIPASILQALHPALSMIWSVTSPIFGLYFFLVYSDFKRTALLSS